MAEQQQARTVARVIAVMEQLSLAPRSLSNLQLARTLGVPPSSMHRLLQKMIELGYVEFDSAGPSYGLSTRLGMLGERLADAGCRSLPMQRLLTALRDHTGYNIMVWVPSGMHVRLAAFMAGRLTKTTLNPTRYLTAPFSTAGLAIAIRYTEAEVRQLALQCRRREEPLGRTFTTVAEVLRSLRGYRAVGHVSGYNMLADGWATLAWPLQISLQPSRIGAIAIGGKPPRCGATNQG